MDASSLLPSSRELARCRGAEHILEEVFGPTVGPIDAPTRYVRRRHALRALQQEASRLARSFRDTGWTAIYDGQLKARLADLRDRFNHLGSCTTLHHAVFVDVATAGSASRIANSQLAAVLDTARTELFHVTLSALAPRGLPSHAFGLTRLRRTLRLLGQRLLGFFGQAKVDGRNNP